MMTRRALPILTTAVLAAAVLCWSAPQQAWAVRQNFFFINLKVGTQDTGATGDTIIEALENDPTFGGPVQNPNREVVQRAVEFDFFVVPGDVLGLGLGIESGEYQSRYDFGDPTSETLKLQARSLLYLFKLFLRLGFVMPYVAVGSGNYYVRYEETNGRRAFRDSAPYVFTQRAGLRLLLGRFALLYETGRTDAPLTIEARPDAPRLELGGTFTNVGVSWAF